VCTNIKVVWAEPSFSRPTYVLNGSLSRALWSEIWILMNKQPLAVSLLGMTLQILRELLMTAHSTSHLRFKAHWLLIGVKFTQRYYWRFLFSSVWNSVAWHISDGRNCYGGSSYLHIPVQITLNKEVAGCLETLMSMQGVPGGMCNTSGECSLC